MRQDRLYIDVGKDMLDEDVHVIVECHRALDPDTYTQVYSDIFLKKICYCLLLKDSGDRT